LSEQTNQPRATSPVKQVPKKNDIIDFFGSLETAPVQNNQFQAFGFDPFAQQQQEQQQMLFQQQQQQAYQEQMQQQAYQEQMQQQAYQEQMLQQQMMLQEQERQRQQQLQQQQFAAQFQSNPHNPFAAVPQSQQAIISRPDEMADLSSNPNAVLDPFASLASKNNAYFLN
jgi:type IV secretory pathway VirB10-like protein